MIKFLGHTLRRSMPGFQAEMIPRSKKMKCIKIQKYLPWMVMIMILPTAQTLADLWGVPGARPYPKDPDSFVSTYTIFEM